MFTALCSFRTFTQAIFAATLLSTASFAAPANNANSTSTASGDGCAQLSQYIEDNPDESFLPASLGYACLQAVPVDVDGDSQLVSEIYNIVRWHSTLAYLKDPPQGYPNPPVDLLGGLDHISDKLSKGGYKSEYDVQNDITTLLSKAYDGHLAYISDVASVVGFQPAAGADLVSLSLDGKALPKVYLKRDIDAVYDGAEFSPSAIQTINNQSAYDYLISFSNTDGRKHDADGRYQDLFYNPAAFSQQNYSSSWFTSSNIYLGNKTIVSHEDGTTTTIENVAVVTNNLTGIDSGEAFFKAFLTGLTAPLISSSTPSSSAEPIPTAFGYPYPVYKSDDNAVSGYFLNDTGYQDVAVLSSPSFEPSNLTEFQGVVSQFLADAVAAKKQYLIVDLRHNGGGFIGLGIDLFKQLFPQVEPYAASRLRGIDTIDAMGQVVSAIADADSNINNTALNDDLAYSEDWNVLEFWYKSRLNVDDKDFASWEDLFGPIAIYGDKFTNLVRHNFSDPYLSDLVISGYQGRTDIPPQPFKAENIVILQDGYCASTCAVFSELMKSQGGVKQIAIGGRPKNGLMVAVGGTKGLETIRFDQVVKKAVQVATISTDEDQQLLKETGVLDLANSKAIFNRTASATSGKGLEAQINYRNNYREGDDTNTPLQFVKDYADCRIWYTMPMIYDPTAVWNTVFDTMWRNGTCVPGSTGHTNSAIPSNSASASGTSTIPNPRSL